MLGEFFIKRVTLLFRHLRFRVKVILLALNLLPVLIQPARYAIK